jgi:hypothetical protein
MEMVQLSSMTHDKLERPIIPLNKIIPGCDISIKNHSRICCIWSSKQWHLYSENETFPWYMLHNFLQSVEKKVSIGPKQNSVLLKNS